MGDAEVDGFAEDGKGAVAVGGGFGTKAPFYAEEIVIPVAALRLGRPVKWTEDRREHFLSATQERDQYWKVAIAVDRDGKILGLRGTMIHDNGAYLPWGIIAPYIAATTVPGPYVVPAFRFESLNFSLIPFNGPCPLL